MLRSSYIYPVTKSYLLKLFYGLRLKGMRELKSRPPGARCSICTKFISVTGGGGILPPIYLIPID
jgi:hypothetical protein